MSSKPEWLVLQSKIFTRWVNQKLATSSEEKIQIDDVTTGFQDGVALVKLITILSEKDLPGKPLNPTKLRVKQLDNLSRALEFCWASGVEMQLKPSVENIADGDEGQIMALVWGIMRKFLKFGDDDDEQQINASDALLMWVNNQIKSYNIVLKDFKKDFHNGVALCALIHKFRPKLIDFDSIAPENHEANLQTAFDAAEKYFGLEQYLKTSDIKKLDEKSMVVYVSEYYYGIAERRKWDLAARRIKKLVIYTKQNDAMRAEYATKADGLKASLDSTFAFLEDRTIDNTMAGAVAKMDEFNDYRANKKGDVISSFLELESLYNHLAMRLADHGRPEFVPTTEGTSVADFNGRLNALDKLEQERNVELQSELNRQHKLVQLNGQHQARFEKLTAWHGAKKEYLSTKEVCETSGAAEYQLNRLAAYVTEAAAVRDSSVVELKKVGKELVDNSYENSADVQSRESNVDAGNEELDTLSASKKVILEDDLARNLYKEPILLVNGQHQAKHAQINTWVAEKKAYLEAREEIDSISAAKLQLSLLEAFEKEKTDLGATAVPALKDLGKTVLEAEYKSEHSEWKFETPDEVTGRESEIDAAWENLSELSATKKSDLDASLAKEEKKEQLRLQFANLAGEFVRWSKDISENAASSHFGFNLAEVEAYKATLDAENSQVGEKSSSNKSEWEGFVSEMGELGVTDNQYTTITSADLDSSLASLNDAIAKRNEAYETELARQRANDALCKSFADKATPFSEAVASKKKEVTESDAKLEDQLTRVDALIGEAAADNKAVIEELSGINAKMEEAGITTNTHTPLTFKDCSVMGDMYASFLDRKKKQLEEEIEHANLRGLTREQYAEIEAQFKEFDSDSSGSLDKFEFRAALFSLNEDRPQKEVAELMSKYGSVETGIPESGFTEFMISVLGDTDTKDEIVGGFKLINHEGEVATTEYLGDILDDETRDYITSTAPAVDGGFDYVAWTDDVFSR